MKVQEENCFLAVESTSNVRTHLVLILLSLLKIIQSALQHLTPLQVFMKEGKRIQQTLSPRSLPSEVEFSCWKQVPAA